MCELNGFQWLASETFEIDRILDRKVERRRVGKVRSRTRHRPRHRPRHRSPRRACHPLWQGKNRKEKEFTSYFILWKGFPPEVATWEPEASIHDDFVDAYEAALEAEAELDAEEAAEDAEDDMDEQ